jgi:hypothetical protein
METEKEKIVIWKFNLQDKSETFLLFPDIFAKHLLYCSPDI